MCVPAPVEDPVPHGELEVRGSLRDDKATWSLVEGRSIVAVTTVHHVTIPVQQALETGFQVGLVLEDHQVTADTHTHTHTHTHTQAQAHNSQYFTLQLLQ